MRATMRKTIGAIALFVTALTAQSVFAYYNPSTGRFLSRDPIGEPGFQVLQMAQGAPITVGFRKLIRELYLVADEYRKDTLKMIREISPCLEPRCRLSLEIIFTLYLMVFERIDIENGQFTTVELNPTPDEIKERVLKTIEGFQAV